MAQGYLRHVAFCNRHDLTKFLPFLIGGTQFGWVEKNLAVLLPREMDFFILQNNGIALAPQFDDFTARNAALATAGAWIAARYGKTLRGEMYPVIVKWGDAPAAQIDRAAVPWFGVAAFGVHVNGFVRRRDGIYLWIAERAADRQIDPGKLDNLIGGGQPIGLSLEDNLCKEAAEEAGIAPNLARTAVAAGAIHYTVERHHGLRRDTLFIYDLELASDFTPRNTDGEVANFRLLPLAEVAALVRDTDRFKFNCNLVIIDFMLRHGCIDPSHGDYQALKQAGLGMGAKEM